MFTLCPVHLFYEYTQSTATIPINAPAAIAAKGLLFSLGEDAICCCFLLEPSIEDFEEKNFFCFLVLLLLCFCLSLDFERIDRDVPLTTCGEGRRCVLRGKRGERGLVSFGRRKRMKKK